ncbi:EamA family transporter [Candidatus Roizmanbacteria bacterium]|nr:EamA family transporter [Candidatus Roizmanbacteria bacterium]
MSTKTKAVLSLVFISFCYVLLSLASRLLDAGFGNFTHVYLRIALGALFAALLFRNKINYRHYLQLSHRDTTGIILMGVVGYGIFVYLITKGALLTSLVNVSVIYATSPFFTVLFSVFLLKKIPSLLQILLVVVSVLGVMMVSTNSFIPRLTEFGSGELYVLASAAAGVHSM